MQERKGDSNYVSGASWEGGSETKQVMPQARALLLLQEENIAGNKCEQKTVTNARRGGSHSRKQPQLSKLNNYWCTLEEAVLSNHLSVLVV